MSILDSFIKLRKLILMKSRNEEDFFCIRSWLAIDFLTRGIIEETDLYFSSVENKNAVLTLMNNAVGIINDPMSDYDVVDFMHVMIANFNDELKHQLKLFIDHVCNCFTNSTRYNATNVYMVRPLAARIRIASSILILHVLKNLYLDKYKLNVKRADEYMFSIGIAGRAATLVYEQKEESVPKVIETCEFQSIDDPEFDLKRYLTHGPPALFYNHPPMLNEIENCLNSIPMRPYEFSIKKVQYGPFYTGYNSRRHDNRSEFVFNLKTILKINDLPFSGNLTACVDLIVKKFGKERMQPIVLYTRNI